MTQIPPPPSYSGLPPTFPPDDLDIQKVSPEFKKEGNDWFAVFNPGVKRQLGDVSLVYTLMHPSVVCCVKFSKDGKYLATGCNRTAQIYDTKTGAKICVLVHEEKSGKDMYIRSVSFSPDGKYLATGGDDKQIRIWDIATQDIHMTFSGHQKEVYTLNFSADGRILVSGSSDNTVRIWDTDTGSSKVISIDDPESLKKGVTSISISSNAQYVAVATLGTSVSIWDVDTTKFVQRFRGHEDSVYSLAFTPDGRGLISASLDKTLKYWDLTELGGGLRGTPPQGGSASARDFVGHKDYVLSGAVSHDGQWVVSGSKDRTVYFWDADSANVQCVLRGHMNSVIAVALSPVGNLLVTGSGDWQARVWSYDTV